MELQDLTGQRFGRLVVLQRVKKENNKNTFWLCKCDCGKEKTVRAECLKSKNTQSCGCKQRESTLIHGKSNTKLYTVWSAMIQRCYNKNSKVYKYYGGRGIVMCDEWKNSFQAFYDWAMANGYDENLPQGKCTIDRINNEGSYEPNNCRWTTQKNQSNNTRRNHFVTINGKTQTMQQWADEYNMSKHTFYARYSKGLRGNDLIAPVAKRQKRRDKNANLY